MVEIRKNWNVETTTEESCSTAQGHPSGDVPLIFSGVCFIVPRDFLCRTGSEVGGSGQRDDF